MARKSNRGAHRSTSKKAQKTLDRLESLPEVEAVIIGRSYGGKSIQRGASDGAFKIQRQAEGGFKGVIQTSKGIQEIFVRIKNGRHEDFLETINNDF